MLGCQHAAHDAEQVGAPDRLVDEARDAGGQPLLRVEADVRRAQHHHVQRRVLGARADRAGERDAVHLRHVHVQDRGVVGPRVALRGFQQRQRLGPAGGAVHVDAPGAELALQDVAIGRVVVDHQHAQAGECARRGRVWNVAPGRRQVQRDAEGRSLAEFAFDLDRSAHQVEQPARDR